MTLEDLLKPNKFGTTPILIIPAIGYGIVTDGYLKLHISEGNLTKHTILPLSTEVTFIGKNPIVEHDALRAYYCNLRYYLPLTSEQYLITNAVEGINEVMITTESRMRDLAATPELLAGRLDDGTGWVDLGYGMEPVTFWVEDILYRLDLQGKLT